MQLTIDRKYLHLPVCHHAAEKRLRLSRGDTLIFDLSVRADACGEWIYSYDVSPFAGQTLELSFEPDIDLPLTLSDTPAPMPAEAERYRPRVHFTAPTGWINDPNGLVFFRERWHMFYQHNPVGPMWGNMHWGHAVSRDLVTWEDLPLALRPDSLGTMFSGSAIVDTENVTGLGTADSPALLLFYTAAGGTSALSEGQPYTQCMAWSLDGIHFNKYEHNPVLPHVAGENRDPKVARCPAAGGYVMSLYLTGCTYALFASEDLLSWRELCRIDLPGDDECPDFHPLPAPDGREMWVLSGASGYYVIGEFDGAAFRPVTPVRCLTGEGSCSYAAQTFSDSPDGRVYRIAWDRSNIPATHFQSAMTVPAELTLCEHEGGLRLRAYPLPAFDGKTLFALSAEDIRSLRRELPAGPVSISLTLRAKVPVSLSLFGLRLTLDMSADELRCGKCRLPLHAEHGLISLRLLCDRTSTEIWTGGGLGTLCVSHIADPGLCRLELESSDIFRLESLTAGDLSDCEVRA